MNYQGIVKGNKWKISLVLICVMFVGFAFAFQKSGDDDPLAIYAPEFIMKHQQTIGLAEEQKSSIKNEIRSRTARFSDLQWEMTEAGESFQKTLQENPVDEKRAVEQLDRILNLEREVKRLQVTLVIRIKNLLTDEQRAKLQTLKDSER